MAKKNKDGILREQEHEYLRNYNPDKFERLSVAVDTVIFSVDTDLRNPNYRKLEKQKLTVLLVKRGSHPFWGYWSLPGGFVRADETLIQTAQRIIGSKTKLSNLYIEQLYTFSEPGRDPRMRVISCAYMALIDRSSFKFEETETLKWFELEVLAREGKLVLAAGDEHLEFGITKEERQNGLIASCQYASEPGAALAFDHADIILEALLRLRNKIEYTDLVFNLMPPEFSITQLQQIYEIILGHQLLAPAFRRKIAAKIEETGAYIKDKGHRPSRLFKYKCGSGRTMN